MSEFQLNLQKHVNMCYYSFNKISINRKKNFCEKFWLNDKFLLFLS